MAQKQKAKSRSLAASLPPSQRASQELQDLYQQQREQLTSLLQELRDKTQQVKDLRLKVKNRGTKEPATLAGARLSVDSRSFWDEDDRAECSFAEMASMGLWVANPRLRKAGKSPVEVRQISVRRLKQARKADCSEQSLDDSDESVQMSTLAWSYVPTVELKTRAAKLAALEKKKKGEVTQRRPMFPSLRRELQVSVR